MQLAEIVIDVTATLSLNRLTGVQRVVLQVAKQHEAISLIRYNPTSDCFELLQRMPRLTYSSNERPDAGKWLVRAFQQVLWHLFVSTFTGLGSSIRKVIQKFGLRFFNRRISDFSGFDSDLQVIREIRSEEIKNLWILDVPKSAQHRNMLRALSDQESARLFFYLYDLIPIDSPEFLDQRPDGDSAADYLDYLNLVISAEGVLCLTEFTRSRFEKFLSTNDVRRPPSIKSLYPPFEDFDPDTKSPSPDFSSAILEKMALSDETHLVLAIAPLIRRKNLLVIFRAIKKLLDTGKDVSLVVVAPILSSVDIATVLRGIWLVLRYPKKVNILNPVSEETLRGLYERATYVAIPSLLEGFGLPIIEAYHYRKPVLISECEVLSEVAGQTNARVLNSHDPEAWANAFLTEPPEFQQANQKRPVTSIEEFLGEMTEMQRPR